MERDVIDLKNPDLYVAGVPHEIFTRLRREDPLYRNPESDGPGFWCATRYDDIVYLGTFILLVVAGDETTRNSISGGLAALAEFPAERQRLIDHPELLPSAVSEIVRYVTPVMHMRRTALCEVEMRGKLILAGYKIIMWYCLANRDEGILPDPFRFDIGRVGLPQLGFGIGEHYCLGSSQQSCERGEL
jgi:cytochrome P450